MLEALRKDQRLVSTHRICVADARTIPKGHSYGHWIRGACLPPYNPPAGPFRMPPRDRIILERAPDSRRAPTHQRPVPALRRSGTGGANYVRGRSERARVGRILELVSLQKTSLKARAWEAIAVATPPCPAPPRPPPLRSPSPEETVPLIRQRVLLLVRVLRRTVGLEAPRASGRFYETKPNS